MRLAAESCCSMHAPRCKLRCAQVRGAHKLRVASSNKQMSETDNLKRRPKRLSAKCAAAKRAAQLVFLILFCLRAKNAARAATSASGWLLLAPKAISKSELNFDNQALEDIPKAELCNESVAQEQQASRRFINVASFANNHVKVLEADAFVCVAEALRILILRHNKIETISPLAFNQLSSLQVLLLDNNQLTSIPSRQTLSPLKSMRHLNLANNRIQRLNSDSFGPENVNLISLNLKGNPLHHLAADALSSLGKLKTLTLSQSELSGQLAPLAGLHELRFYHLDRAKSLQSISSNLCQNSPRLATLVLKSNQLEQIPHFVHCQSLLLLDLSHNRIRGALSENFLNQANLIDLYLGHNQIELIEERAFVGLIKLQVLELNNNRLKHIHSAAFLALKATLYDLNLSNNHQLNTLSVDGLESLVSFKSYGNEQLRELPYLKSAAHLALTYAYHCCDYLPNAVNYDADHSLGASLSTTQDHSTLASDAPLMSQFLGSVYAKLKSLFAARATMSGPEEADRSNFSVPQFSGTLKAAGGSGATEQAEATQNLTELILWPTALFSGPTGSDGGATDLRAPVGATSLERGRRGRRELRAEREPIKAGRLLGAEKEHLGHEHVELEVRLIDELVWWQVEEIRRLHSVQLPFHRLASRMEAQRAGEQLQMGALQRASERRRALLLWPPDEEPVGNELTAARAPLVIMDDAMELLVPGDTGNNNIDAKHLLWQQARKGANGNLEPRLRRRAKSNSLIESDELSLTKDHQYDKRSNQPGSAQSTSEQTQPTKIVRCLPEPSAFLPCQDLFDTWWLRLGIWSVFFLSFTGNILVIVVLGSVKPSSSASALTSIMWLAHSKRHIDVPRFLVINLAFADLLMALYLGLLAFVDVSTLGEFKLYAIKWQFSNGCKLAGFLGVLSSELSVFILAIITLERNYAITNAVHLNRRLSLQKAVVIMLLGYVFALVMAMMPLNGISDYRKFSICLPLDVESNLSSQLYIITLIGINTFSFILLLSCYLRMYCAIRGSQAWNTNDLRIAKRMSILVITDFLCWMPIILVAITSLFGYHLIGTKGLKILTIFILPLNSVANPFLYAITTKKFKRDLDTLVLRARSSLAAINYCSTEKFNQCTQANVNNQQFNGCHAKSCNAKVFIGYNQQYQHNLIMLNKKKNKKNKSRDPCKQQRDQQHAARGNRHHLLGQQQFHPDGLTPNHVTMNKTTCSCRAMDDKELRSPTEESENLNCELAENEAEFVRIKRILHAQPKIVLNTVDNEAAPIDLISSRCVVHKSRSTNIVPTTATATLINNNTISTGTTRTPLLMPTQACTLRACSAGTLQQGEQCESRVRCSLRPLSLGGESRANLVCAFHRSNPPVENTRESSSPYTDANQRTSHQSRCSGGSMEAACRASSRFLQVTDQQQHLPLQLPSATSRSASACGYRNHEVDLSDAGKCRHIFQRQVSGSCDTMQHREECAKNQSSRLIDTNGRRMNAPAKSNTHSRSINRLLFEPIAKAWSSIQISLNSGAAQVSGDQPQQTSQRLSPLIKSSSSRSAKDVQGKANTTTTSNAPLQRQAGYAIEHNKAHLLTDTLKMSSPTKRSKHLSKLYERRMSRSCDLISASSSTKSKQKEQYSSPASSSTNDQQATTTASSGDYDDDQRILLATINRIAQKRSGKGRLNQGEAANNSNNGAQFGNFRSKCTRCRSWSPALLSKLEDCIYQIKFKLPSFGSGAGGPDGNEQNLETMHECYRPELSSQSSSSEVEVENLSFEEVGEYRHDDDDDEDDEDNQLELDEENDDGDDEDDKFNEKGLLEWSQKRRNILTRHKHHGIYQRFNRPKEVSISMAEKRRRLRKQQSSTNSDTMSTRTGATVTTNMSISFDSATGIPMHNPHQPIQEQDGSCNSSEIVDQSNMPCKSSSDRMH